MRGAAAQALKKIGWQPGENEESATYWIAEENWEQCASLGALAVEPLLSMIKESDNIVRQGVAKTLGKIGDTRAVEPLIAALKDKSGVVQRATVRALGKIGDARAVEPFIAMLDDISMRQVAAEELGEIGDATRWDHSLPFFRIRQPAQRWPICMWREK